MAALQRLVNASIAALRNAASVTAAEQGNGHGNGEGALRTEVPSSGSGGNSGGGRGGRDRYLSSQRSGAEDIPGSHYSSRGG